jgi:PadR family transcriptional regulator PadR
MPRPHPRPLSLSPKEMLILERLTRDGELYGLQLVAGSRGRLKRGTVYVTLGRMEDKGYIVSRLDADPPPGGGLPRRLYAPTALGRKILKLWAEASGRLVPEFA